MNTLLNAATESTLEGLPQLSSFVFCTNCNPRVPNDFISND